MTNEELANELERLAEKATPGPFRVNQIRGYTMDYIVTDHPDFQGKPHGNYVAETGFAAGHTKQRFSDDAALIAAALNNLPAIISALRDNSRMREALQNLAGFDYDTPAKIEIAKTALRQLDTHSMSNTP